MTTAEELAIVDAAIQRWHDRENVEEYTEAQDRARMTAFEKLTKRRDELLARQAAESGDNFYLAELRET